MLPKQFQNVFGSRTLYQQTYDRVKQLVAPQNIFVVTNRIQQSTAIEQLPDLPQKNVIAEPYVRSTAPCISVAASALSSLDENAVMVVLPADHLITQEDIFISQLKDAVRLAEKQKALVTIGITPTHPETGFGYIHYSKTDSDKDLLDHRGHTVLAFKEKPDHDTAVKFLQSGDYLWNSGMFVWRVDVILDELKKNLTHFSDFYPQLKDAFSLGEFDRVIEDYYQRVQSISIDYAVMERAKKVLTLASGFGWSDVGSWDEVYRLANRDNSGNSFKGDVISVRTKNTFVWSEEKPIAVVEVEDLIVVETKDSILICRKGKSQAVKEIVDILRKENRQDLV